MPLSRRAFSAWSIATLSAAAPALAARQNGSARSSASSSAAPPADADPAVRAEQLNQADARPLLRAGAGSAAVVRAQILLDRVWFSPGEIDGRYGANLRRAVEAWQAARGLRRSGTIDAETWASLGGDTPVFGLYTISPADANGPFRPLPKALADQAQLQQLGYTSLDEALGERFHCSPRLLHELNRGAVFEAGRTIVVPDIAVQNAPSAGAGNSIEIDKARRILFVLAEGGQPLAAFPISIGGPRDPLPVGRLKIVNEVENPSFTYDPTLLRTAPPGSVKTQLPPGPNNPVGSMWLGLSKPHWGIHGTPAPERLGHEETNGCIHLTNWDVHRLSRLVKAGCVVDVRA